MGSRANSTQTAGRVLKVAKTLFGLSKYSGRVLYQTQPWKIELLLRLQQNEPCVFRFISLTISKGPSCCCPFQLLRNSSSKFRSPVSAVYRRALVFERRPGCVHGGVGIDTSTSDCLCLRAVGVCVEHTRNTKSLNTPLWVNLQRVPADISSSWRGVGFSSRCIASTIIKTPRSADKRERVFALANVADVNAIQSVQLLVDCVYHTEYFLSFRHARETREFSRVIFTELPDLP